MATRFSTEEVLAFVTGDDNFGLSDSESSEDSDGAIHAYRVSRTVTTEDFVTLVGEDIPEQGPSASDGLGFSQVSEDKSEEADPFVIELLYTGSFVW